MTYEIILHIYHGSGFGMGFRFCITLTVTWYKSRSPYQNQIHDKYSKWFQKSHCPQAYRIKSVGTNASFFQLVMGRAFMKASRSILYGKYRQNFWRKKRGSVDLLIINECLPCKMVQCRQYRSELPGYPPLAVLTGQDFSRLICPWGRLSRPECMKSQCTHVEGFLPVGFWEVFDACILYRIYRHVYALGVLSFELSLVLCCVSFPFTVRN